MTNLEVPAATPSEDTDTEQESGLLQPGVSPWSLRLPSSNRLALRLAALALAALAAAAVTLGVGQQYVSWAAARRSTRSQSGALELVEGEWLEPTFAPAQIEPDSRPSQAPAAAPSDWAKAGSTGCSNWADVKIGETVELSVDDCGSRCQETDHCVMFNFKPKVCGESPVDMQCILYNGECQEHQDPCWDLYKPKAATAAAADTGERRIGSTGCSNWDKIRIGGSVAISAAECASKCKASDLCAAFGYTAGGCGFSAQPECMMFADGCDQQADDCWDFYPDIGKEGSRGTGAASPRQALVATAAEPAPEPKRGVGCANWEDILMTKTTAPGASACHQKCRSEFGCLRFGFKPYDCGGFGVAQECMLFRGECEEQLDECWDLYQEFGHAAGDDASGGESVGEVAPGAKEGVGCANWADIKIFNSVELTVGACRAQCQSRADCVHFTYMPNACRSTAGHEAGKECMLFAGECQEKPDDCWDFYADPGGPRTSVPDESARDASDAASNRASDDGDLRAALSSAIGSAAAIAAGAEARRPALPTTVPAAATAIEPQEATAKTRQALIVAPLKVPTPSPALQATPAAARHLVGKGCSNWQDIEINRAEGQSVESCHASCLSTPGCQAFNFLPSPCGGAPWSQLCILFRGGCQLKPDGCFELYMVGDESRMDGTGCSNWASIEMDRTTGESVEACRARCRSSTSCLYFNYMPRECGPTLGTKVCILYNGICSKQPDECYDLYSADPESSEPRSALAASSGPELLKTGCSNWADIEMDRTSGLSVESCRARCQSSDGCTFANYKAGECGETSSVQECILFNGVCAEQWDECYDLYKNI